MKLSTIEAWALMQLQGVRHAAALHGYSLGDSLSDFLTEGPLTRRELTALAVAVSDAPDFDEADLDLVAATPARSDDEVNDYYRFLNDNGV